MSFTYCGACQSNHDPLDFCNADGRTEPQLTMLQQKALAKHLKGIPNYAPRTNPDTGEPFGWDNLSRMAFETIEKIADFAEEAGYTYGYGQGHDDALNDQLEQVEWEYRVLYLWHGKGQPIFFAQGLHHNLDSIVDDAADHLQYSPDTIMWVEARPANDWRSL